MRIGIFGGDTANRTIDEVVADARQAEADGFASYWLPQIFGMRRDHRRWPIVGREVPRIELGTAVVPTYPRHPMMLAQQALTTQAASGGRFILGIGLSHQIVIESMFGMSFEKPARHMREYLAILAPLVHGEAASFDGETLSAHGAISVPARHRARSCSPRSRPEMLELAGGVADGTITWMTGPATLADHIIPSINAAAARGGRPDPACLRVASGVHHRRSFGARASVRPRSSRSTARCRRTARCSTAREPPVRPTSRSSATLRPSRARSPGSPTSGSPTSRPRSSAAAPTAPRRARFSSPCSNGRVSCTGSVKTAIAFIRRVVRQRNPCERGTEATHDNQGEPMSFVRLLPAWLHAVADYAVGGTLIIAALAVGGSNKAVAAGVVVGAVVLAVSMLTKYPLGVVKVLPFTVHSAGDYLAAALLVDLAVRARLQQQRHRSDRVLHRRRHRRARSEPHHQLPVQRKAGVGRRQRRRLNTLPPSERRGARRALSFVRVVHAFVAFTRP